MNRADPRRNPDYQPAPGVDPLWGRGRNPVRQFLWAIESAIKTRRRLGFPETPKDPPPTDR